jgi:hypothetical protein
MQFGSLNARIRLLVEYELLNTSGFLRFSVIAQSELHDLSEQVIVQFLWDPSATKTLHQLGGKPKHKKGGMSGITHGWAIIWVLGPALGLVEDWPGPMDITYKSTVAPAGKGIKQIINNRISFPFTAIHLPS